jgi:hypothetical protein
MIAHVLCLTTIHNLRIAIETESLLKIHEPSHPQADYNTSIPTSLPRQWQYEFLSSSLEV